MSTLTTATADTEIGRLIRDLLDQLDLVHSPLYRAVHTDAEIAAAETGLWEAIADAATSPREAVTA
ncbi:hypothetical protein FFT09_22740 [Saccharomonospora piscinae]|uniref:hypothetical protein n=1 Tax=Saccharomonospora piscinae TaxID=687388 RepID=UPI0011060EB3|nr:hypothetical protein [Saccharomonospora piscinae]TLW89247.1 hypothetical protein FFT09_22740 [Saccharomonospora piscinae]